MKYGMAAMLVALVLVAAWYVRREDPDTTAMRAELLADPAAFTQHTADLERQIQCRETTVLPGVTFRNYQKLREGVPYAAAVSVLCSNGKEISRAVAAGSTTVIYAWNGDFGGRMTATFQNDRLVTKAQAGLK